MLDDESDNDGSDSRSAGTCAFPFHFKESVRSVDNSIGCDDNSVGCVRSVGSGFFVLIEMKSIGDVVKLVVFLPIGAKS